MVVMVEAVTEAVEATAETLEPWATRLTELESMSLAAAALPLRR